MKTIKKYTTFQKLKSSEINNSNLLDAQKKHEEFEKAIKEIISFRTKNHEFKNKQ